MGENKAYGRIKSELNRVSVEGPVDAISIIDRIVLPFFATMVTGYNNETFSLLEDIKF